MFTCCLRDLVTFYVTFSHCSMSMNYLEHEYMVKTTVFQEAKNVGIENISVLPSNIPHLITMRDL